MKQVLFPDGAVLAHPFEIAERAQQYAAENAAELLGVLFSRFGVLAPNSDELAVAVERDDRFFAFQTAGPKPIRKDDELFTESDAILKAQMVFDELGQTKPFKPPVQIDQKNATLALRVSAGTAVVARGPLQVEQATTITVAKIDHLSATVTEKTLYVNLLYAEREDTPVELLPFGSGQSNLRRYGTYRFVVEDVQPAPETGVAIARVTLKSQKSVVHDLRPANAARFRTDATLVDSVVDPELVPEVERLLQRPGVVDEILALLRDRRLGDGYVVVEPAIATPPLFVRSRREPVFRQAMRQKSLTSQKERLLWSGQVTPDPSWDVLVDWNLYGVQVNRLTPTSFRVHSGFNLTAITLDPDLDPLFLRFSGVDHKVTAITGPDTVTVALPVSGAVSVDPLGALHNGVNEVQVQAEPDQVSKHLVAVKGSQVVVDHLKAESMTARLQLPDGTWRISLLGTGNGRKSVHTLTQALPTLPPPLPVASIDVVGYQFEPATLAPDGTTRIEANPFDKVQIGSKGEPLVDTNGVDRFVESVQNELRRIQELEVGLTATVTFPVRTQVEGLFGGQITAGVRIRMEMLTKQGFKFFEEKEVYRPVDDVVSEVAWIDLNSRLFRGGVSTTVALGALGGSLSALGAFVEGDVVKDTEIVRVTADPVPAKNGYYRYEASLAVVPSGIVDCIPMVSGGGNWVKTDLTKSTFQPAPLPVVFSKMAGGADYRLTVWPIGEMTDVGAPALHTTEKLRTLYNARLGVDLHKTLADMYQTFSFLLQQVDPARLDQYADELLARLQAAVQQAAAYGNPPVIDGPFKVNETPPPVVFTGTNLGGVIDVTMRYVPLGARDERSVLVEADFVVQQAVGAAPSVLVRNLPDFSSLNPQFSPVVTLVFDAGVKGQGLATVRYDTTQVSIFGPTSASFKGLEVRRIASTATIGNTASYYGYFPERTSGSLYDGPLPKIFPTGVQTLDTPHPYLSANQTSGGQTVVPRNVSARGLRFDVGGFLPPAILDVRVREVPSEVAVQQRAFVRADDADTSLGFERSGLLAAQTTPLYHQIEIHADSVTVWVEEVSVSSWGNKNFVLEAVHYDGPIIGDNCRGLNIASLGTTPDTSGTGAPPSVGIGVNGSYLLYEDGAAWVKRAGAWVAATPLKFKRHRFSVLTPVPSIPGPTQPAPPTQPNPEQRDVLVAVIANTNQLSSLSVLMTVSEQPLGAFSSGMSGTTLWTKEHASIRIQSPALTVPIGGTRYELVRWEVGDGDPNNWRSIGQSGDVYYTVRASARIVRALYQEYAGP